MVSADGFIGMEYEHSPCEGVPVAVLHDYVLKYMLVTNGLLYLNVKHVINI